MKRQFLKDRAENKQIAAIQIVKELYETNNYKNTLIYCPKGTNDDEEVIIFELQKLLNKTIKKINNSKNKKELLLLLFRHRQHRQSSLQLP